jgi:hypothetical protein
MVKFSLCKSFESFILHERVLKTMETERAAENNRELTPFVPSQFYVTHYKIFPNVHQDAVAPGTPLQDSVEMEPEISSALLDDKYTYLIPYDCIFLAKFFLSRRIQTLKKSQLSDDEVAYTKSGQVTELCSDNAQLRTAHWALPTNISYAFALTFRWGTLILSSELVRGRIK